MQKTALITWINWQDGSYLADFLLSKWYKVHWILRMSSITNTQRINHLIQNENLTIHYWDLLDASNLISIISKVNPDELYNLAAQTHVSVSFEIPEYTTNVIALWTLRLLEAIKILWLEKKCKFYQASTSELFWWVESKMQKKWYNENSLMFPKSPYWCAKMYAMNISRIYKESYWLFVSNGILFNHESPVRWETFVSRKITIWVAKIFLWKQNKIYLWNLNAMRDWWHAKDYVIAMWLMLQIDEAEDFVISSWTTLSVRDFVNWAFEEIWIQIEWKWVWIHEKWYNKETWECLVEVDPKFFRPNEVDCLLWDCTKAKQKLWWHPKYSTKNMCKEMVQSDMEYYKNNN